MCDPFNLLEPPNPPVIKSDSKRLNSDIRGTPFEATQKWPHKWLDPKVRQKWLFRANKSLWGSLLSHFGIKSLPMSQFLVASSRFRGHVWGFLEVHGINPATFDYAHMVLSIREIVEPWVCRTFGQLFSSVDELSFWGSEALRRMSSTFQVLLVATSSCHTLSPRLAPLLLPHACAWGWLWGAAADIVGASLPYMCD